MRQLTNKVCGGYILVGFRKSQSYYWAHTSDEDAFLYSLRNDPEYPQRMFPVLKHQKDYALSFFVGHLCCFGQNAEGICLESECNLPHICNDVWGESFVPVAGKAYLNGGSKNGIHVKELELFQLLKE